MSPLLLSSLTSLLPTFSSNQNDLLILLSFNLVFSVVPEMGMCPMFVQFVSHHKNN